MPVIFLFPENSINRVNDKFLLVIRDRPWPVLKSNRTSHECFWSYVRVGYLGGCKAFEANPDLMLSGGRASISLSVVLRCLLTFWGHTDFIWCHLRNENQAIDQSCDHGAFLHNCRLGIKSNRLIDSRDVWPLRLFQKVPRALCDSKLELVSPMGNVENVNSRRRCSWWNAKWKFWCLDWKLCSEITFCWISSWILDI